MNLFQHVLTNPHIEAIGWTLIHFLWQGATAALFLACALVLLHRVSSKARYVFAYSVFALMALSPPITFWVMWPPAAPAHGLPQAITRSAIELDNTVATMPIEDPQQSDRNMALTIPSSIDSRSARNPLVAPRPARTVLREWIAPCLPWFVVGWLLGVVALSVRLFFAWSRVRRIRRRGTRVASDRWQATLRRLADVLAISRPVQLLESCLVEVPTVIGWLVPVILVPVSALTGLAPQQLEALLAHELAHIRRQDYLANLIQTVVETLLFYHPAVWWISNRIRAEREECCDELAVSVCDRMTYARALLAMEELRGERVRLAVAATGGSLLARISRLLERPDSHVNRAAWWITPAVIAILSLSIGITYQLDTQANDDPGREAEPALTETGSDTAGSRETESPDGDWGEVSHGIQCRLIPVSSASDVNAPATAPAVDRFEHPEDITYAVELRNVSDQPIKLLGVHYGESFAPPTPGKPNAEGFGPFLFDFDFVDESGKPVDHPSRTFLEPTLMVTGMSVHHVDPGKSFAALVRPAKFQHNMQYHLAPGSYRVRVRYHGPSEQDRQTIKKHWPDQPYGYVWFGEVTSGEAVFTIAGDPNRRELPELVWGDAKDGLRAAVEFVAQPAPRSPAIAEKQDTRRSSHAYPYGTKLDVRLHVQNVSDHTIQFASETWRQDDQVTVRNEAGEERELTRIWYSGWPIMVRWTLKPGQTARLHVANIGIAADDEAAKKFEHPTGRVLIVQPGRYTVRFSIRMGSIQQRDSEGNVVVPGKQDWQGTLVTGEAPVIVRQPEPGDAVLETEMTFTGLIEFYSADDPTSRIGSGFFEVNAQNANYRPVAKGQIAPGPNQVPNCPPGPFVVTVRAPGYEETTFYDVTLKPDMATALKLVPAASIGKMDQDQDGKAPETKAVQERSGIQVRVLDESGQQIDSCYINLWHKVQPDDPPQGERWQDAGTAWERIRSWYPGYPKPESGLGFGNLAAGEYRITVASYLSGKESDPTPAAASATVQLDGQRSTLVTIQLAGATPLLIRVIDSRTQRPIPRAEVRLFRGDGIPIVGAASGNANFFDRSDELGQLRYSRLVPGMYRVEVQGPGATLSNPVEYANQASTSFELEPGKKNTIDVSLESRLLTERELDERWPHSVRGHVYDQDGEPMAGVEVRAHTGMGTLKLTGSTRTDSEGHYVLRFAAGAGVARGGRGSGFQVATISAHQPGYFEKNLGRQGNLAMAYEPLASEDTKGYAGVILPAEPKELDFIMLPAARISGTLVDEAGVPLPAYRISLTGPELPPSTSVIAANRTDSAGRFEFRDIPTGYRFQFLVESPKAEPPWVAWASPRLAFLDPGERNLAATSSTADLAADRLQIQIVGAGVNWRDALAKAAQSTLDYQADQIQKRPDRNRIHIEASLLQLRIGTTDEK